MTNVSVYSGFALLDFEEVPGTCLEVLRADGFGFARAAHWDDTKLKFFVSECEVDKRQFGMVMR